MNKCLIYQDENNFCRIVIPKHNFMCAFEDEENAVARFAERAIPDVVEFLSCLISMIPDDITFRDAWVKGDASCPIKIDFVKALQIHRDRLQESASIKITHLEIELQQAIKEQHLPRQIALRKTIEILSSIHLMNLTHCKSVEDIKQSVPKELKEVWSFYEIN